MNHYVEGREGRYELKTEDFFNEIETVYRKYGISISHEDYMGGFVLEEFNEGRMKWLKNSYLTDEAAKLFEEGFTNEKNIPNKLEF